MRAHHQQTLSHRRLDITAVDARLRGRPRPVPARYQAVRWASLDEARTLAIASGTAALLAAPAPTPPRSPPPPVRPRRRRQGDPPLGKPRSPR
ncbi:MAG: hypothetical protein IPH44_24055 [Myxococcales bacterium]|nr:hypothetical protein [Myxococcales bacterium]